MPFCKTAASSPCFWLPLRRFSGLALALVASGLIGCAEIPELDGTVPDHLQNANYPALVPLNASLTTPASPGKDRDEVEKDINRRVTALQNKARRLNAPVIDPATQARMQTGVTE